MVIDLFSFYDLFSSLEYFIYDVIFLYESILLNKKTDYLCFTIMRLFVDDKVSILGIEN